MALRGCAGSNYPFLTSKERDNETGLDFFEARYFASMQGRFTSSDPIMITADRLIDPQEINLYNYARNNPLLFTDPTGEDIDDSSLDKNEDYQEWKWPFPPSHSATPQSKPSSSVNGSPLA